jgi:hypothetical protein
MSIVRAHNALIAIGIIAVVAISQHVDASPIEHLVAGPGPLPYGSHVEGDISTNIEVDSYTFSGLAGDHARAVISGKTGGFHPQLMLRGPGGTVLDTVHCDRGILACSVLFDDVLPTTGTYTINVSQAGLNHTGDYSLHLDRHPPTTNWLPIEYGAPRIDDLDHLSDSDYYAFLGATGTTVEVTFAGNTGGLNPHLEIWDPAGSLISDTSCDRGILTCVTSADLSLVASGVYKVGLSDVGFNLTGNYTFGVSCAFGTCPKPFPEPSTYALMFAGLGCIAFLTRRRRGLSAARFAQPL